MKISLVALTAALCPIASAYEDTCTQFKNIYTSGTDLCERMWDDAFQVVDDDTQPGYTMWFFDQDDNPNDEVTRQLFPDIASVDECYLQYFHKQEPSPEDDNMRECHPWKNNACCDSSTVESVDALNEGYGDGYQWDRCGPMSQACERFFVMEACLYECEPNAGLVSTKYKLLHSVRIPPLRVKQTHARTRTRTHPSSRHDPRCIGVPTVPQVQRFSDGSPGIQHVAIAQDAHQEEFLRRLVHGVLQ